MAYILKITQKILNQNVKMQLGIQLQLCYLGTKYNMK